jgi:MFS transporter, ACS family, tartrate transporter
MTNQEETGMLSLEARTIRKVRIRILPFLSLLFVVALLDRNNIGFAALTMNKELAITSQQFGLLFGPCAFFWDWLKQAISLELCCT